MNDTAKESLRRSRPALEDALRAAGARFRGNAASCPFHEDKNPSSSIYADDAGIWRFKCQASSCGFGGDVFDVVKQHTGRSVEDQLRDLRPPPARDDRPAETPRPAQVFPTLDALKSAFPGAEAVYVYTHPTTRAVELVVFRLAENGRKRFLQASPCPGGFHLKAPSGLLPIYNRSRVADADEVIVVEGEKCVHAMAAVGVVATTSPGGAGKAARADWSVLAGKRVTLWPDHDAPNATTGKIAGRDHMADVLAELGKLEPAPVVSLIDPDLIGLAQDGSDVVDYLDDFAGDNATADDKRLAVLAAVRTARPMGGSSDLAARIEDAIAGRLRTIGWPWGYVARLCRALMPGTVTCVCGDPGSGKSFFIIQAALWWLLNGVKVAIYMLEEDRAYHLGRALAQLDGNADLTDPEWVHARGDEARAAYQSHREALDALAARLDAAPDAAVTHDALLAWVRRQAAGGARVIVIDPITAAAVSDKPWLDDLNFIMSAKAIARDHGCSIILTTHPRKGRRSGAVLDDLAGGAAFPRFSQTVFWITRPDAPRDVRCAGPCGPFPTKANRTLKVAKTRNGPGAGVEIGFFFDPRTLTFAEQGPILGEGEEPEIVDPFTSTPAERQA